MAICMRIKRDQMKGRKEEGQWWFLYQMGSREREGEIAEEKGGRILHTALLCMHCGLVWAPPRRTAAFELSIVSLLALPASAARLKSGRECIYSFINFSHQGK